MSARIWRGAVMSEDSDAYADYMQDTGVAGCARTPGNRGGVDARTRTLAAARKRV